MDTFDVNLKSLLLAKILLTQCTVVTPYQGVNLVDMFVKFASVCEFHGTHVAIELFQFYM